MGLTKSKEIKSHNNIFLDELHHIFMEKGLIPLLYEYYQGIDFYIYNDFNTSNVSFINTTHEEYSLHKHSTNLIERYPNLSEVAHNNVNKIIKSNFITSNDDDLIIIGNYLFVLSNVIVKYDLNTFKLVAQTFKSMFIFQIIINGNNIIAISDRSIDIYNIDLIKIKTITIDNCITKTKYYNGDLYYISNRVVKCLRSFIDINTDNSTDLIEVQENSITSFDISNNILVIGTTNGSIKLYRNYNCISTIIAHNDMITDIIINENNIITASNDKTLIVFDLNLNIINKIKTRFWNIKRIKMINVRYTSIEYTSGFAIIDIINDNVVYEYTSIPYRF